MIPTDAKERKGLPICTGMLDYFPDALLEVARCSKVGNDQHNPGQPLHWAKEKSQDEADALVRHLLERGTFDNDGVRHSAKVAWRALALLQREIDAERADTSDDDKLAQAERELESVYAELRDLKANSLPVKDGAVSLGGWKTDDYFDYYEVMGNKILGVTQGPVAAGAPISVTYKLGDDVQL